MSCSFTDAEAGEGVVIILGQENGLDDGFTKGSGKSSTVIISNGETTAEGDIVTESDGERAISEQVVKVSTVVRG